MGTGEHWRIWEEAHFGKVGVVCVCGECHGVVNNVFLRCVFERHDVKSHDHCSVLREETASGGHASLQPADPCSTDPLEHPTAACPRPMTHAGQKCPQFCGNGRNWMLNELCLELVPQKKKLRERGAVDVKHEKTCCFITHFYGGRREAYFIKRCPKTDMKCF